MIKFTLKCANGHLSESWLQSSAAFEKLQKAGMVVCPECGIDKVEKALMAPNVSRGRQKPEIAPNPSQKTQKEKILEKIQRHIKENSEYVGMNFVSEARAMYLGDSPERSIYGEADPREAKALIEDGVPVTPLPMMSPRKIN